MFQALVFFIPLTFVLLFEGLGIKGGREISLYILFCWPLLICTANYFKKKQLIFPKKLTLLFLVFFIFSLISTILAVNVEKSFYQLLYYLACYFILIYVYSNKKQLEKPTIIFIFVISSIFIICFSLISYFPNQFYFLIPKRGFQYIYPFYKTHNPLGTWLLIPISMLIPALLQNKNIFYRPIFAIFFVFLLLSYSRSAYLAVATTILIVFFANRKKINARWLLLFVFGLILFFINTQFSNRIVFFNKINQFLTKTTSPNIYLENKGNFGNRNEYFSQAIQAIKEKAFFGYGPENIIYASRKYAKIKKNEASTSDMILLEIFAEQGFIAGALFLAIVFLILKSNPQNSLFFCLLAMLLLFQTDSSQRYYSYFLFFFIISGLIYEEKEKIKPPNEFFLFTSGAFLFLTVNIILSSVYLKKGEYQLSFYHNPLNQKTYPGLIEKYLILDNKVTAKKYIKLYNQFFPEDSEAQTNIGKYYEQLNEINNAKYSYIKALESYPRINLFLINKLYGLEIGPLGIKEAQKNFKERLNKYFLQKGLDKDTISKEAVANLCIEKKTLCKQAGIKLPVFFYQPEPNSKEEVDQLIPYKADYSINADGLNERYNYSTKKPKNIFRIVAMGDSNTFGLYVNAKDNWTEILEEKINKELDCPKIDKFEVINLGVNGYDIEYAVYRYQLKGERYQPDLILWLLRRLNFYQLNEIMLPKVINYEEDLRKNKEYEQLVKKGNLYPASYMAYSDVIEEYSGEGILKKQEEFFNDFGKIYQGKTILFTQGVMSKRTTSFLKEQATKIKNTSVFFSDNLNEKKFYFPSTDILTPEGHKVLADVIYRYIINISAINCDR